jgi:hypothetical protein
MLKLTLLVWIIVGVTVAGVAMTAIVSTPSLADQAMTLIPILCGGAFVLALPISWMVAKKISETTGAA